MTEQEKEIATIKERTLKVKLSDADCERILEKCGRHGLTVGELFENFIGDLVGGTYSNGSDERDFADRYFERCWFGMFPENTLLHHLLEWGFDVDDFITCYDENEYFKEHPEEYKEEVEELEENEKLWFEEELQEYLSEWQPEKEPNMTEEIETIRKWLKECQELKGDSDEQN